MVDFCKSLESCRYISSKTRLMSAPATVRQMESDPPPRESSSAKPPESRRHASDLVWHGEPAPRMTRDLGISLSHRCGWMEQEALDGGRKEDLLSVDRTDTWAVFGSLMVPTRHRITRSRQTPAMVPPFEAIVSKEDSRKLATAMQVAIPLAHSPTGFVWEEPWRCHAHSRSCV